MLWRARSSILIAFALIALGATGLWLAVNSYSLGVSGLSETRNEELAWVLLCGGGLFSLAHFGALFYRHTFTSNRFLQVALFAPSVFALFILHLGAAFATYSAWLTLFAEPGFFQQTAGNQEWFSKRWFGTFAIMIFVVYFLFSAPLIVAWRQRAGVLPVLLALYLLVCCTIYRVWFFDVLKSLGEAFLLV